MAGTNPGGLVATTACPSGMGYDVGLAGKSKVYACQTTFTNMSGNTADTQCKNGYTLCMTGTSVDLNACSQVGTATQGFFISAVEVHRDSNYQTYCGQPTSQHPDPMWAGCGRMLTTNISTMVPCPGFTQALDCPATGTFNCSGQMINARITDVANSDQAGGVLCCGP
jgi:hypothetical protein